MLTWEDANIIKTKEYISIADEIEEVGKNTKHIMPGYQKMDRVWTQSFKIWEYPFAYIWLKNISKEYPNKKPRVLDFGGGRSPFAQYLANKGFDAWCIDNDMCKYIQSSRTLINDQYPDVTYWIGDILNFNACKFDFIISCSVLEHIIPPPQRDKVVTKLKTLLNPGGKTLHIIDFYFPAMKNKTQQHRIDCFALSKLMEVNIPDNSICPGASTYDWVKVNKSINFTQPERQSSRIAIGDDY